MTRRRSLLVSERPPVTDRWRGVCHVHGPMNLLSLSTSTKDAYVQFIHLVDTALSDYSQVRFACIFKN